MPATPAVLRTAGGTNRRKTHPICAPYKRWPAARSGGATRATLHPRACHAPSLYAPSCERWCRLLELGRRGNCGRTPSGHEALNAGSCRRWRLSPTAPSIGSDLRKGGPPAVGVARQGSASYRCLYRWARRSKAAEPTAIHTRDVGRPRGPALRAGARRGGRNGLRRWPSPASTRSHASRHGAGREGRAC